MSCHIITKSRIPPRWLHRNQSNAQNRWSFMKLSLIVTAVALGFDVSLKVQAMDRWAALSQIETRDNDSAVGAAGEISRYQMKPRLWRRYARSDADWRNPIE